jgi:hypothetical protein
MELRDDKKKSVEWINKNDRADVKEQSLFQNEISFRKKTLFPMTVYSYSLQGCRKFDVSQLC